MSKRPSKRMRKKNGRKRRRFLSKQDRRSGRALQISANRRQGLMLPYPAIAPNVFPQRMFARLSYGSFVSLDAAANAISEQRIAINDVFDPDYEAGGHQPYGFDQYASMYKYYIVYKAQVTATFISSDSGSSTGPALCAIVALPYGETALSSINVADLETLHEYNWGVKAINSNAGEGKPLKLTFNWTNKSWATRKDVDDEGAAVTTASPSTRAIVSLAVTGINDTVNPSAVNVIYKVRQWVMFDSPKYAQS